MTAQDSPATVASNDVVRENGRLAVVADPVRRAERLEERRVAAAVIACTKYSDAVLWLDGARLDVAKLDPDIVQALHLGGRRVRLDDVLAAEIVAAQSLLFHPEPVRGRRRR